MGLVNQAEMIAEIRRQQDIERKKGEALASP